MTTASWGCDVIACRCAVRAAALPDAALVDWVHRTAGRAVVGGGELRRVRQRPDHSALAVAHTPASYDMCQLS